MRDGGDRWVCRAVAAVVLSVSAPMWSAGPAFAQVDVSPSTAGMPGDGLWQQVLGWGMQWGLWLSLAGIVLGAGGWGVSGATGGYNGASRGQKVVLGGAAGGLVVGRGRTMVNLLFNLGRGG